ASTEVSSTAKPFWADTIRSAPGPADPAAPSILPAAGQSAAVPPVAGPVVVPVMAVVVVVDDDVVVSDLTAPCSLSGWEGPNEQFRGYFNFSKGDSLVAGGMRNDGAAGVPDHWNVYLAVEGAEATVASATAHGGGVIVPAMAVADLGTMAVVTDVGGAAIGM